MADVFQWTTKLSVRVALIDEQHQELIKHINGFLKAVLDGEGLDKLGGTLDFLVQYVDVHFRTEEYFMEKYQYPLRMIHEAEHRRLTNEVMKVAQSIKESSPTRDVVAELATQVGNWVVEHVQRMDMRLGQHLAALGDQLDSRVPDNILQMAHGTETAISSEADQETCPCFDVCSNMFDKLLDEEHRRFWIDRYCNQSQAREKCSRKREMDRGVRPDEVPQTMLPSGEHLPHLAR